LQVIYRFCIIFLESLVRKRIFYKTKIKFGNQVKNYLEILTKLEDYKKILENISRIKLTYFDFWDFLFIVWDN